MDESDDKRWIAEALDRYGEWLHDQKVKPRTKLEYSQNIRSFLNWCADEKAEHRNEQIHLIGEWHREPSSLDELADWGRGWINRWSSQATINLKCSVLNSYGRSIGLPVDFHGFWIKTHQKKEPAKTPVLTDLDLKRIRAGAKAGTPKRACVELAIAGLTAEQITTVVPASLNFSRSERLATVELPGTKVKVMFDSVSLQYFRKVENRNGLPSQQRTDEEDAEAGSAAWKLHQVKDALIAATSPVKKGPPRRMLVEAGVRRAIGRGLSPEALADWLGYKQVPERWWIYAKDAKRSPNLHRPIVPELDVRPDLGKQLENIDDMSMEELDAVIVDNVDNV